MLKSAHSQISIRKFTSLYNQGRLNLNPGFQRKSVWGIKDRRRLLVSVFEGIPLPTIYLYKRKSSQGLVAYDVIDGKQRLETLLLYTGEGPLVDLEAPLKFQSDLDDTSDFQWRYWEDLEGGQCEQFRNTVIAVITVEGEFSEVADLFVRINSTGKKLTGQERRHAFYDHSNVLRAATILAEAHRDYFQANGIFSTSQMNRMLHIEFVTELLIFACTGWHQNKKTKLDSIIRGDQFDQDQMNQASKQLTQLLKALEDILPGIRATRFRRRADFYTLLTLLLRLKEEGQVVRAGKSQRNELVADLLTDFGQGVELVNERASNARKPLPGHQPHIAYLMTVKEGTDSATQRKRREEILYKHVLNGVFDDKDVRRRFTEQQRRILWNLSPNRICAECKEQILSWEDMHADHVVAYIRGGKTTIGNGAITHKICNIAKGG